MSSLRLPEAIRCERLREEVIRDIEKNPAMLEKYRLMEPEDREMLMEFFLGNRGLNVLYDPFFKKIMNRERLESFLSQVMDQTVEIVEFLPLEMMRQSAEEMMGMISEAIRMLDEGDAKLQIEKLHDQVDQYKNELKEKDNAIKEKDNAIKEKDNAIKEKDNAIKEKDNAIKEKDNAIKEKDNALKAKDNILAQKDELIEALKNQLEALKRGS